MGETLLRRDFWQLSGLALEATVGLAVHAVRMGLAATLAVVLVAVLGEGVATAFGGDFGDLHSGWLVPLLVATATIGSLLYVLAFYHTWRDEPRDHLVRHGIHLVDLGGRLESFVFESTTYDAATVEQWTADVPGRERTAGLVVVAVSLATLAVALPVVVDSGYVGHGLVPLAVLVIVAVVRSDVDPVRPLSEQVGFALGGALFGLALWPAYVYSAVALGWSPRPVASLLAFPAVGVVALYCLLLADDASRVRRGTYPPEAEADLADADLPDAGPLRPLRPLRAVGALFPDASLRTRLAATLAAVVLLNLAVVAVVAPAGHAIVSAVGGAVPTSGPVLAGGLLLAAVLLVVAEARYGYRRALAGVDAREAPRDHAVAVRVRRLAQVADVPAPAVAVMESSTANSFSVGNGSDVTVVVTTGLLETVDGAELDAVLAHEVAHVANRDTTVATVTATLSAVSGALRARERRLADWLRLVAAAPAPTFLLFALPALLTIPVYLGVSVVARGFLACNAFCVGLHARTREYAADRAAATLVGDPESVAAALETLSAGGVPERDARLDATASLGIVPQSLRPETGSEEEPTRLQRWFPWILRGRDTTTVRFLARLGRALEWRPTTHPPTEDRVRRLREMDGH